MATIEGKELFLTQPNFASPPRIVGQQIVSTVELSEARRIAAYTGKHPLHAMTHEFIFKTKAEAEAFEEFFDARGGQHEAFWIPGWHAELNPVANITNGGNQISVSPVEYASVYDPTHAETNRLGHYVFVHDYDGTIHTTRINSVSGTNPEVLVMNTVAPKLFTLGQFYVGFLYHVRFMTDELEMEWFGANEAHCSVPLIEAMTTTSAADV